MNSNVYTTLLDNLELEREEIEYQLKHIESRRKHLLKRKTEVTEGIEGLQQLKDEMERI